MSREKFFTEPDGYAAVPVKRNFDIYWNKVLKYEADTHTQLGVNYTRADYVALFNSFSIRAVSNMLNAKAYVKKYIAFMVKHGYLPPEQLDLLTSITKDDIKVNNSETVSFFKNVGMLRSAIEKAISSSSSYDNTLYDLHASILYLAWYGLTEDEIITFPKACVLEDGIMHNGKKIAMPYFVCAVLNRQKAAEGYYQQAKGVIYRRYQYGDNLLRGERNVFLTKNSMRTRLCHLNEYIDYKQSLEFDVVYKSGMFNRMYTLECDSIVFPLDDMKFVERITGLKFKNALQFKRFVENYNLYKGWFS